MPLLLFLLLPWIIMTGMAQAADLPIPPPVKSPAPPKREQPAKEKPFTIGKPVDKGRLE
jgi:hypothetical protein